MEINVLAQLEEIVNIFGVDFHRFREGDKVEKTYDVRLYELLNIKPPFDRGLSEALKLCDLGGLYIVVDSFFIQNMAFIYDNSMIVIGPFIISSAEDILPKVMEKNNIPVSFQKELKEFYNSLPLVTDLLILEKIVMQHMSYLMPKGVEIVRSHIENFAYEVTQYDELQMLEEQKISMEAIEHRYGIEDRFMEAIRSGNAEKVYDIAREFSGYRMSPRVANGFRNGQNSLIILNTLMRRAVQEADVHPAHIDRLSEDFANRIEAAKNEAELNMISRDMTRKYCLLVRNHSLIGHSEMVRDAINYIDFNLTEDLSLNAIAEKLSVSASYLSKQFKNENNKTLTNYVNEKRVFTSLKYLATTDLPIQNVAELVGIYDENYFSRLFKKYQNITPSKYRNLMRRDSN